MMRCSGCCCADGLRFAAHRGMRWTSYAFVALLVSPAARAGALAQVVHGLGQATGSNAQPAPPAGAGTPSWTGAFAAGGARGSPAGVGPAGVAPPPATGPDVTLQVSFGVMSVHDSDGAVALEVGFVHDDFGLVVRGRSFFEAQSTGSTLRLDLGSIQAAFR